MTHPAEDGFHEIQLTGKQLVFLFMATTVVAVVIFLCGVLVGRGVRAERTVAESTAAAPQSEVPPPAPATQSSEPSPATGEDLSYAKRLQGDEPREQLKSGSQPAAPPGTTAEPPTPAESEAEKPPTQAASPPPAQPAVQAPAAATPARGTGGGWVVQVAALKDRGAAESIRQRLTRKGYQAFIVEPTRGAPAPGFRVRVGPFQDRGQAEQASRRLEREEQFKPFITR